MKISVIIINFNGISDTRECLMSLAQAKKKGFEIETIVVDNGSTDNSVREIKKEFPETICLENSDNLGFAEGNNVGIRYAIERGADYLFLLNNDTTTHEHIFIELAKAATDAPSGGIFCPKIYFARGYETHTERYKLTDQGKIIWYAGGVIDWKNMLAFHRGVDEIDSGQYDVMTKTVYGTGCALFVRRGVFEKTGLFDRKFYLYYEDLDFSLRARQKGFEIYYVPKALLWHKNAGSAGGTGSDLQSYYITRNRLLIGMRYAPWRTKLALLREATNLVMGGTRTQRQAVGDFLRKKYGSRELSKLSQSRFSMPKFPTGIKMPHLPKMPDLLKYLPKIKPKRKNT
ncbi:MAG: Glycosyl transferase family 2 [Candidatus Gottesmanbacteria bacterium GW2011_GWB1_43_11]|uniref:Glycosyl transferase family 2 n=1 Tax=Candidatus Gottesmanbacteria bacterium GW2011_GWB1_43_11 TaxID=1618446 RepID=A0A0G1CNR0_9BACT|nr:MAG: Glycosyl transferase family 2 [Candidatus Gottesmanbacteria bacterium GW2011_GWA2_42_16]KKS56207.1 MAG: Glycosyl transferase family 2 [Candidatus Gottesmanbacteria bacterium GW2011_GWA1_42_26]KKS82541.1 MAG: Glycosyl transferase family 2 [Candidatus Gottesmanbacteria bacterium GW2011_GWC1_43_10]KKS87410.1 MAG: Glycosyl transferase family 2 [Candidatus Gottesmanbacteria bacterium GW2011_GWB1_43_11]OGG10215.1 MAG: hypothetical protein A2699_01550 [Candidatus Gottesmanbacteria bacterium RI